VIEAKWSQHGVDGSSFRVKSVTALLKLMRMQALELHDRLSDNLQVAPHLLPRGVSAVALPLAGMSLMIPDDNAKIRLIDQSGLMELDLNSLLPAELKYARPARLRSFLAGRLCAEWAMQQLQKSTALATLDDIPGVGVGSKSEPVWPSLRGLKIIGSITHNAQLATSAVATCGVLQSLGIDSEEVMNVQSHAAAIETCLSAREIQRWPELVTSPEMATVVYAAKQAFYKALWPLCGRFVEFKEMELTALDRKRGVLWLRALSGDMATLMDGPWAHRFVVERGCVHATSVLLPENTQSERIDWINGGGRD
jgi:4'-phosphopantetheinyl transferase EntD